MSSPPVARTPRLPSFPLVGRSAPAPAVPSGGRLPRLLLRATATGSALLGLAQTVLAGSFLNGHYEALRAHELAAMALGGLLLAQLPVAALVRRGGGAGGARGPWWPLGATPLLLAAFGAQMGAGYGRAVGVHVTLGVLLVSGLLFGLVGAWRPVPVPRATATSDVGRDAEAEAADGGGPGAGPEAGPEASPAAGAGDGGSGRLPRPTGAGADAVEVTP
ncbi:hypothetical protein SAMN05216371_2216 [Streptomyces sp. TLI_053]|uniref:hypothetical protein n=1 Tax=Streptomyces sp. TLI_053 TaxID=1855352 RepID=UPI0008799452|nr:hypothetical protein [Streptomyces sp. TLI_053]SDT41551.1 hypothetical protein SAMN05216371_2216 [Streptomyces sp. TLI_053]